MWHMASSISSDQLGRIARLYFRDNNFDNFGFLYVTILYVTLLDFTLVDTLWHTGITHLVDTILLSQLRETGVHRRFRR